VLANELVETGVELIDRVIERRADGDGRAGVTVRGVAKHLVPFRPFRLRRFVGDERPFSAAHGEDAMLGEPLIGAGDRVGVDAKLLGEVADGGDAVARLECPRAIMRRIPSSICLQMGAASVGLISNNWFDLRLTVLSY
jgi:hypothetical protein